MGREAQAAMYSEDGDASSYGFAFDRCDHEARNSLRDAMVEDDVCDLSADLHWTVWRPWWQRAGNR
jgi:hypothetical protein